MHAPCRQTEQTAEEKSRVCCAALMTKALTAAGE
jgi:hypothetical protein